MRGLALLAVVAAACYSPTVRDCDFLCADGESCPDGLECDATSRICRDPAAVAAGEACANAADAASVCEWSMVEPSNFTPALLPPMRTPWRVTGVETYNTDGTGTGGPPGVVHSSGGVPALLVHVASFSVASGAVLDVVGPVPLIIVADAIDVSGTINVHAGSDLASCAGAGPGGTECSNSPGGGGGGFGAAGGEGSAKAGGTGGGLGGGPSGTEQLVPLVGGCRGGPGASADNGALSGGVGGAGGGALQLTARGPISVSGSIQAEGTGGGPGASTDVDAVCATSLRRSSGGGGGGSGGAILIEGCQVTITESASVCASGGGGGGGGVSALPVGMANRGNDGTCIGPAAGGAGEGGGDNAGGAGGYGGTPTGGNAPPTANQFAAGAGGGGAVGRIRIHSSMSPDVAPAATIVPSALLD